MEVYNLFKDKIFEIWGSDDYKTALKKLNPILNGYGYSWAREDDVVQIIKNSPNVNATRPLSSVHVECSNPHGGSIRYSIVYTIIHNFSPSGNLTNPIRLIDLQIQLIPKDKGIEEEFLELKKTFGKLLALHLHNFKAREKKEQNYDEAVMKFVDFTVVNTITELSKIKAPKEDVDVLRQKLITNLFNKL
jgi:hypothetical protein